jgi:D-beta-D-heptose 7-phosphate kinase/D-beta-D-heptose 1-phosphate adenosyltransferase
MLFLPPAVDEIDPTGAGDVFISALTVAIASGIPIEDCCDFANYAAALSVKEFGTTVISQKKLLRAYCPESKIVSLPFDKKPDDFVVFTNGCFDGLHAGHIHFLKECKKLRVMVDGRVCPSLKTKLVVGVNTDASVLKVKKHKPRHFLQERLDTLAQLDCIDALIAFDEETPANLIQAVLPSIVVKGSDYKKEDVVHGSAEVRLIPMFKNYHSSDVRSD